MTRQLKNCPFCGSIAELDECKDHHGEWFNLGCSKIQCPAHNLFYTEEMETMPKAIEVWNTRIIDAS
jgi:Restriction alleviation protein Lar